MISYEPGYWGLACMLQGKGSVFPKAMVWAVPTSILAGVLHWVFASQTGIKEIVGIGDNVTTIFGGFNFILGFLVVFRSQQAYSRWWEGGTLLQQLRGEWFNAFSSLIAFKNNAPEKQDEVEKFQQQLVRLFSLLFACALGQVSHMQTSCFEMLNLEGFDEESLAFLQSDKCPDKCEITLQWIQRLIVESEQKQFVKIAPPILSRVYNELGNGIVNLNNATKIKEFLIPFPLAQMIMVMLIFHATFTPLVCAATVNTALWASLLTFIVVFSYWSVLYIALELEMPFGDDPNDLPLRDMARDMNMSLVAMMEPLSSKVPNYEYFPETDNLDRIFVDMSCGKLVRTDSDPEPPQMLMRSLTGCSLRGSCTEGLDKLPTRMEEVDFSYSVNAPSAPKAAVLESENCFGQVPGQVEVKVAVDYKAHPSLERKAVAPAVLDTSQFPAPPSELSPVVSLVEMIRPSASQGSSSGPLTVDIAPIRLSGQSEFFSEHTPSRSEIAAGADQRQTPSPTSRSEIAAGADQRHTPSSKLEGQRQRSSSGRD